MFALTLEGVENVQARLADYPQALRAELLAKAEALANALAEKVRSEKLDGAVLSARSGALKASIAAQIAGAGDDVEATVGSFGDVKYAAIQEYGGKTPAHEILPDKAKVLAFVANGATHFARRVAHPGSVIPERSYLRSSLEEMRDEIVAALAGAAERSWGNA